MHFSFSELRKIKDLAKRFVNVYLLNFKVFVLDTKGPSLASLLIICGIFCMRW